MAVDERPEVSLGMLPWQPIFWAESAELSSHTIR